MIVSNYNNWVILVDSAIKSKQDGKIWLKSCFGRGVLPDTVSEIKCFVFQQNNVNPNKIYNLSVDFHPIIFF